MEKFCRIVREAEIASWHIALVSAPSPFSPGASENRRTSREILINVINVGTFAAREGAVILRLGSPSCLSLFFTSIKSVALCTYGRGKKAIIVNHRFPITLPGPLCFEAARRSPFFPFSSRST